MNDQPVGVSRLDEFALLDELRRLRKVIPDTPGLNPIVSVAFDLSRQLEAGEISLAQLKALAGRFMDRACVRRARALRERIGFIDSAVTMADFKAFVTTTIPVGVAPGNAFAQFKERWSRARSGIVLTAHPTFALSAALSRRMIEIATSPAAAGSGAAEDVGIGLPHRPDAKLDLAAEHAAAQAAVMTLRSAYSDLLEGFTEVATARFGDEGYTLRPELATLASWVGYDLDGRTDIQWSHSFLLRLQEKAAALIDLRARFIGFKLKNSDGADVERLTRQVTGKLDLAISAVSAQASSLEAALKGTGTLAAAANEITRVDSYNMTTTAPLLELLDQLIAAVKPPQTKCQIAAMAGLIEATGLGTAHIHVRVNAVQLNNAFRAFVHAPWTRDLSESQAFQRIVDMIDSAKPETVNFETLDLETATAIRQFGVIAQMQKHIDRDTPIRFLIAECESPATVLIALFFAKLFGVLDIVDISPLFETPTGLESGARLIGRLLEVKAYRDYVRGRKRLAVQTGFSDAGRFIGQIAATLAIERLHHALADLMARNAMGDVELLIFSTHGESMGRGAHPGDLDKRLRYVFSDEARRRFHRNGQPIKHETSFQGGDGYLFFGAPEFAVRALATIVKDGAAPPAGEDPFYADINLNLDFLLRLRDYQQSLFAHPGYRAVLGAFGPNLLFKTGSRAVKRQSDLASPADRGDPSRMRAIPNNAILQQFGYIANVVAGLGAAVGSEREEFVALAKRSPRLRLLIEMIARGKQLSSLNAVGANAMVFDAGFWALRASWGREAPMEPAFRSLAVHLLEDTRAGAINGLVHHLRLDAIDLHAILESTGLEGGKIPDDNRLELDLLQAIRLALIMRIFILSAQLPRFTPRNDVSHSQLFGWALGLEIPEVTAVIRQAFPRRHAAGPDASLFAEKASYRPHGIDDYGRIETEILEPMEAAYEFIREIGTGIEHHFGAFG